MSKTKQEAQIAAEQDNESKAAAKRAYDRDIIERSVSDLMECLNVGSSSLVQRLRRAKTISPEEVQQVVDAVNGAVETFNETVGKGGEVPRAFTFGSR